MKPKKAPANSKEWGNTANETKIGIIKRTSKSKIINDNLIT